MEPGSWVAPLFGGRDTASYAEFLDQVRRVADELVDAPEVQRSYEASLTEYLAPKGRGIAYLVVVGAARLLSCQSTNSDELVHARFPVSPAV